MKNLILNIQCFFLDLKDWYIVKVHKYLICIWLHRKHRCYPEVWKENSTFWHCAKCYPCGKDWDRMERKLLKLLRKEQNLKAVVEKEIDHYAKLV